MLRERMENMNFKILKKDLMKRKSMNFILLLFVILSAMFISSSINNLIAIASGTSYFFEISELDDFIFLTMRTDFEADDSNEKAAEKFLEENKDIIDDYTADEYVALAKNNLLLNGEESLGFDNLLIYQLPLGQQKFFGPDNKELTQIEKGTICVPVTFASKYSISIGDELKITAENGFEKSYEVSGFFKDALLGSDLMGTKRLLVHEDDLIELRDNAGLPYGMTYSVRTPQLEEFKASFNQTEFSTLFNGDRNLIQQTYLMDIVICAVLLLVSVCLILISAGMLRFMISFTINEDYKEIGIMKAIGMPDPGIRKLYISKYTLLAVTGGIMGFLFGIPFGKKLLESVTQSIVVKNGNSANILIELLASACVAGVIILFAYRSTKRIKKMSPMDAIRQGNTGERYHKKGMFFLKNSRLAPTTYLAFNDVLCNKKKFAALFFTSLVGLWLLIMPINTLTSEKISKLFSIQSCDFFIAEDSVTLYFISAGDIEGLRDYMDQIKEDLTSDGIPVERVSLEVMYTYKIRKDDESYKSLAFQGINTKAEEYFYDEGSAPIYDNEIALAYGTAEAIHANIGDTVYITMNNEEIPFLVCGLYQSMNNMGHGIRFHEDAKLDASGLSGGFVPQIFLTEKADPDTLQLYMDKAQKRYKDASIKTTAEYIDYLLGSISNELKTLKNMILILVLFINILVVTLMQKMFFIREQSQIGMLKSMGFSNGAIIRWQTKRIALVLFLGMLAAALTGTPFSKLTSGQVFKIMGAKSIEFVVKPLEVYLLYPVAILIIALFACVLSIQKVRKISVQEINNIE